MFLYLRIKLSQMYYMDYKDKYIKYKNKYKLIKNNKTDKIDEIYNFLTKSKKEDIKDNLLKMINYKDSCPNVLGQGAFGKVYVPKDKTYNYNGIDFPIVIKEERIRQEFLKNMNLNIINDKLYINGYNIITTELLILSFVRKLWHKTVHLPLVLSYGTCEKDNLINQIITVKYGLDEKEEINLEDKIYLLNNILFTMISDETKKFSSYINNVKDLFTYIHYKKDKNDNVILPNGIKCNIIELYDYICISYLMTYYLLTKNDIYVFDIYPDNIFIHWLDNNSYYGNKNIKNVKEIIYKIDDKYYKIKTFGFVIILGDLGLSMIKIKDDIILIGNMDMNNLNRNEKKLDKFLTPNHRNIDFMRNTKDQLTTKQYNQTICCEIFNSEPYYSYPLSSPYLIGTDISFFNKSKTTPELLLFFHKKYGVNKYKKSSDNILIEV